MRTAQFLVTAALAVLLAGCNSKATVETPAATPVRVAIATRGPAAPSIRTNGLLANLGLGQLRAGGLFEHPLLTSGDDLASVRQILRDRSRYHATDVIAFLLGTAPVPQP